MCLQGKRAFICACANVLLLLETELQCLSPINERNVGFKRERGYINPPLVLVSKTINQNVC